jgi:4-amino-4-deoxy-L-arabinose transferase-like glycosyltransferase
MKKAFWIILGAMTVLRLLLIAKLGLGDDEVYYWVWSKHLALSYYDHPPLVSYIIWVLTTLFGDTAFLVHLGALISVTLFSIIIYKWSSEMFSPEESFWGTILIIFSPVFFVGGVMMVPDAPLGVFWVLTLWLAWRALKYQQPSYWYLAGLSAGLGALSKYNALLLPGLVLLYIIFSPEHRFWLRRREPYLALLIMAIIFLPVIVWNARDHWASFYFQFLGRHHGDFSLKRFLEFIGTQAVYVSPIAFILALAGFYKLAKVGFKENQWSLKYLFWTSFPLVGLFSLNSFFSPTFKPHWTAFGYIGGLLGAAVGLPVTKKRRNVFIANVLFCVLFIGLLVGQVFWQFLPIDPKEDPSSDVYGWPELGQEIKLLEKNLSPDVFLLAERYQTGSPLSFATGQEVYVLNPKRVSAFNFWQDEKQLLNRDAIYFTHSRYLTTPEEIYKFDMVKWEKEIPVYNHGKKIRTFYLYYLVKFGGVK